MQRFKGVTADSRKVKKGDTFVAIRGLTVDGHDYIEDAIKNGAVKIYGEENIKKFSNLYERVESSRKKLAELAADFYNNPSSKLKIVGVTGTKGKTTTAHMIAHLLEKSGKRVGIISSISDTGFHVTSPDIISLNKFLNKMVKEKKEYVVLEVSSHGIDQGRVEGIKFDVIVLTNIKPEHLDYHKNFAEYKKTKVDWFKTGKIQVKSPDSSNLNIFPGEFNNINAETALEVAEKLGIGDELAKKAIKTFKMPEGRMEEIKNNLGIRIFVDFAHTPDSLEKALLYLKSLKPRKLISVFGCAGERDPYKRPKMGKISTQIADFSVFTAEDSRSEDIFDILNQMSKKATKNKYVKIPERGEAIAYAFNNAKKGDIVGIFGKGHEKSMCYNIFEHPWSDQKFINNYLDQINNVAGVILAAGKGTRMKSNLPKVIHEICGRPMISYSLENLRNAGIREIVPVVGYKRNMVKKYFAGVDNVAVQQQTLGTGHALSKAVPFIKKNMETVIVVNGDDSAFYNSEIIRKIIASHKKTKAVISFVSLVVGDPFGLGRVVRDKKGNVAGIVEQKDANEFEQKIKEVNDGLYVFDRKWMEEKIKKVKRNSISGEYYIVDLVKMAIEDKKKVNVYKLTDSNLWQGINTKEQLEVAEEKMRNRINYEEK